ncbi:MAG TPA: hypothetical protein VK628_03670, partial [Flavitalea sp.]|nr:hypothetical protein [Flavitalea sp.]
GVDTGASSSGSNIFKLYTLRTTDYGFGLPSGVKTKGLNLQMLASYELRTNLFLDAALLIRNRNSPSGLVSATESSTITAGLRLNIFRREYDY